MTATAAAAQATAAATPLLHSTEKTSASSTCVERKAGSHVFRGVTIRDSGTVSMGNFSSTSNTVPRLAGHFYSDFTVSGNKVLRLGNEGSNSDGHVFQAGVMKENEAVRLGDYADPDQRAP
ncbi:hypothetical protein F4802DRAFT_603166 [Xylaria palmicola]|nr:hypothetical protein F4802DRAFT_603166 [Xylaria palmicola]